MVLADFDTLAFYFRFFNFVIFIMDLNVSNFEQ